MAVINGWTEGSGYDGLVEKDGGERNVVNVLLVNEDYPIYADFLPSVLVYGNYNYNPGTTSSEGAHTHKITISQEGSHSHIIIP